jgi:hypothetical protein
MRVEEVFGPTVPTELNEELIRLSRRLDTAQVELKRAALRQARKEHAYRKAKAEAYPQAEGTVQAREATVDRVCERERLQAKIAGALRDAAMENVRNLRAQLSALQSVCASVRSEMELAGKGPNYQ